MDRNFFSAAILIPLARDGVNRHWHIRAKKNLTWKAVRRLGPGDEWVEMTVRPSASEADETLERGAAWPMRAIRYKRRGFRPQTLLTSMVDAEQYPAEEIIELYHERWELELGFNEVKTEMLEQDADDTDDADHPRVRESRRHSETAQGAARGLGAFRPPRATTLTALPARSEDQDE